MIPNWIALLTASALLEASNFSRMCLTCVLTVFSEINSSVAICELVMPRARHLSTSISLLLKAISAGIPWELAVETENDRTIEATVAADLAIHAMLEGTEAAHLEQIDSGGALPELPVHKINLYGGEKGRGAVVEALADLVRQNFLLVGGTQLKAVAG